MSNATPTPTVPSDEDIEVLIAPWHTKDQNQNLALFNFVREVRDHTREAVLAKVISGIETEASRGGLTFAGQEFLAELKDQHAKRD